MGMGDDGRDDGGAGWRCSSTSFVSGTEVGKAGLDPAGG